MTMHEPTPIGPDFNPGEARWCDEHNRLECTKQRKHGAGPCHAPAVRGLPDCKLHCGLRPPVAKAKGEAKITAWSALGAASGAVSIDYRMAVLGVLQMTWLRLGSYSELLKQQVERDSAKSVPPVDPDAEFQPGTEGLIGFNYGAAGKDGNIYAQSEAVRALVLLEAAERDRVVKYAEVAHKMGINERLTSLAERWGDVVATRVIALVDALDLTPEQAARVPALVQSHLGSFDTESLGVVIPKEKPKELTSA